MRRLAFCLPFLVALGAMVPRASADDWSLTRPRKSAVRPSTSSAGRNPGPLALGRALSAVRRDPFSEAARALLWQALEGEHQQLPGTPMDERLKAALPRTEDAVLMTLLSGFLALERGDLSTAQAAFGSVTALSPERPEGYRALAELAARRGDAIAQRDYLKDYVLRASGPDRTWAARSLALLLVAEGALAEAQQVMPDEGRSGLAELARAAVETGQGAAAAQLYEAALEKPKGRGPGAAALLLEMARAALEGGNAQGAVALLERAHSAPGLDAGLRSELWELRYLSLASLSRLSDFVALARRGAPSGVAHLRRLSQAYETLGQPLEAVSALRKAVKGAPSAEAYRELAALLSRLGMHEEQLRALQQWRRKEPDAVLPLLEQTRLLVRMGAQADALRELVAAARSSHDSELLAAVYEELVALSEPSRADEVLRAWTQRQPRDAAALMLLVEARLRSGSADGIADLVERAVKASASPIEARRSVALLMLDNGLPVEGCRQLERTVAARPEDLDLALTLARNLARCHRMPEAIVAHEALLARAELDGAERATVRRRLVELWHARGDLSQEVRRLERAFGFDRAKKSLIPGPAHDSQLGLLLVDAYLRLGHGGAITAPVFVDLAEGVLQALHALSPDSVDALRALERLRAASGDEAGAMAALEALLDADPQHHAEYLERLSERAARAYRDDDALRYATALVEASPEDATAHARLAALRHTRGQHVEAVAGYERAIALSPGRDADRLTLARLLMQAGQWTDAERHLHHLVDRAKDDQTVALAAQIACTLAPRLRSHAALEALLARRVGQSPTSVPLRLALLKAYAVEFGATLQHAAFLPRASVGEEARLQAVAGASMPTIADALLSGDAQQETLALGLLQRLPAGGASPTLLTFAELPGDALRRQQALIILARSPHAGALEALWALTRVDQVRVRAAAAYALAVSADRLGPQGTLPLLKSETPQVRCYGALGLAGRSNALALSALAKVLQEDASPLVRSCAAYASAAVPHDPLVGLLLKGLKRHRGPEAATYALALLATEAAPLEPVLVWALRAHDRTVLEWFTHGRPGADFEPVEALPVPSVRIRDVTGLTRTLSAARIHRAPLPAAAVESAWLSVLRGPTPPTGALSILAAAPARLSPTGPEAQAALAEAVAPWLGAASARVRGDALALLVRHGLQTHDVSVVAGLRDAESTVRRAGLAALADNSLLLPDDVGRVLVQIAAGDPRWVLRRLAVAILRPDRESGRETLLLALRDDEQAFVRARAAKALAGVAYAREALTNARNTDIDARVRRAAAIALGGSD